MGNQTLMGKPTRISRAGRALGATMLIVALSNLSVPSSAEPSRAQLDQARAQLHGMNANLSLLVEQYNQAKVKLAEAQQHLEQAQTEVDDAGSAFDDAKEQLGERAAVAYKGGVGSELNAVLGAESFADFSYRLEFISRAAENDEDLATRAEITGQRAQWAADDFAAAKQEQAEAIEALSQRTADVKQAIAAQEQLVERYEIEYQNALEAAREAERQAAAAPATTSTSSGGGGYGNPSVNGGVSAVIAAAQSAIGSSYQWGGASPSGFDCSGLTMWAWAHAGVSLPHSSSAQYASLPHVSKSDLQPGDLVFFYNPIHHVGLYIGGNQMIHAFTEGKPVGVDSVFGGYYGGVYVGAARPG
ncbi:MAG: NlpC/P60 family protein [Actinomycetota bacterium]